MARKVQPRPVTRPSAGTTEAGEAERTANVTGAAPGPSLTTTGGRASRPQRSGTLAVGRRVLTSDVESSDVEEVVRPAAKGVHLPKKEVYVEVSEPVFVVQDH